MSRINRESIKNAQKKSTKKELEKSLKRDIESDDDDNDDESMSSQLDSSDSDSDSSKSVWESESDEDDEKDLKKKKELKKDKKYSKKAINDSEPDSEPDSESDSEPEDIKKKRNKNKNKKVISSDDEDIKKKKNTKKNKSKQASDSSESENEHIKKKSITSKKNKSKQASDSSESENEHIKKKSTSKKNLSKKRKSTKHSDSDSDSDYSEDDRKCGPKDKKHKNSSDFNIIFSGYGCEDNDYDYDYEDENEEIERFLDKNDQECGSDDEKTFMKESYIEDLSVDTQILKEKKKNQSKDKITKSVDTKYLELQELKKTLIESSTKKPNNKILQSAIQKCKDSINKLVKKSRTRNAKEYHELTKSETESGTCEIQYFKNKLSNTEQMNIMKELKEINKHMNIDKPYRLALLQSNIPPNFKANVLQKLNAMKTMDPSNGEYHKMKNWIDMFMRIPFGIYRNLTVNINDGKEICSNYMINAKKILDDCVYGMEDTKIQILQMIGQWITNPSAMGTAIAIHGAKGVGKTSIVKEGISKILGREFAFLALGGAGDSSYLEGHSFCYEGSNCGKIAQILVDSKCMNPVIYFDELDKISETPRGDEITNVLTHLTDTTQNNEFHDKYFAEVNFDLSKCLFIFSYNDETKINPILKDRMYNIHVKGYDTKEKIVIANKYLLPKIREQVNFNDGDVIIQEDVLSYIITNPKLTQNEEGVRNLKRCLEIIHTKLNLFRLVDSENSDILGKDMKLKVEFPFTVSKQHVDTFIKTNGEQNQSVLAMYV
jgi:hypothetical protein